MNKKISRDEELRRKRVRRFADLMAAQEAARSMTGDSSAPRPPSAALSRLAQREEEVRRAFAAQDYDLLRMHQGVGNDAIRNTLDGAREARRDEERPGAALLDALLARDLDGFDAAPAEPASAAPGADHGAAGVDDGFDPAALEDAITAVTESAAWDASQQVAAPTHVTVRDPLAGLDVTYDLAGGAPDVNLAQVKQGMGGGAPLDPQTREYMEWRFGVSFERVRVHTGPKADAMSKALFAHAFALGADLAFQSDAYRPGTLAGDRLLAHELTHIVQAGLARPLSDDEHRELGGGRAIFKTTEAGPTVLAAKATGEALQKSGSVSEPTDSFEIEADSVAARVVGVSRAEHARAIREAEEAARAARRAEEEAKKQSAGARVDAALQSGGRSLDGGIKGKLEALFGRPLDAVRVHDDGKAADAAQAISAHAFTVGTDVVFGANEYRPGTTEGDALIAHEVTHVVQNLEGRAGRATGSVDGVGVTSVNDEVEREAYAVGDAVAAGALDALAYEPIQTVSASLAPAAAPAIARAEGEGAEEIRFTLNLGNTTQRITIPAADAGGTTYSKAIRGIPGLQDPATAHLDLREGRVTGGSLRGTLACAQLTGGVTLRIDSSGTVSGGQEVAYNLPQFSRGSMEVRFSNGAITASKTLAATDMSTWGDEVTYSEFSGAIMLSGVGTLSARGSGSVQLGDDKLAGPISVWFRDGAAGGTIDAEISAPNFNQAWNNGTTGGGMPDKPTLRVSLADGRWTAPETAFDFPAQGRGVSGTSQVTLSYAGGRFSGGGSGRFEIGSFISGTTNTTFAADGGVSGTFTAETASFSIGPVTVENISLRGGLTNGTMNLSVGGRMTAFGGRATGSFTGNITNASDPTFGGSLTVNLPAMRPVTITMAYEGGAFSGGGTLTPNISGLSGSATLQFTSDEFSAEGSFEIALPIVQNATMEVQYADGAVSAEAQIDGGSFNIPGIAVTDSSVTARLGEEFTVSGSAGVTMAGGLVTGRLETNITGSNVEASISSTFNPPGINPVDLNLSYSGGGFRGSATTAVNIPFTQSTQLTVEYANGRFSGNARANLAVPFIQSGSVAVEVDPEGTITGTVQVAANDVSIPPLTVSGVSVEGSITSEGQLSLTGTGTVTGIPAVNEARLRLGVSNGGFSGSVEADINVPGLRRTTATVELHEDGSLSGSAEIEAELAGATGSVRVEYADGGFSGSGTLEYSRGKFSGSIEAAVSREGALSGTGRVSYAITDDLTVTGSVTLREDGTMVVGGELECPDRIDLFEKEWRREIFSMRGRFGIPGLSIQLPVVGVVGLEAQLSGSLEAFANVGLYLTDITASGTFDTANNNVDLDVGGQIRGEAEAGITAAARLAVGLGIGPAFIGGYVQIAGTAKVTAGVGAGVHAHYNSGTDVLGLGINLNANAGLAFDLTISGGITASVDLWLTRWEHDWELASKTWTYSPGVNFEYNPQFNFNLGEEPSDSMLAPASTPSVDGNALAQGAAGQAEASGGGGGGGAQRKADPNLPQPKGAENPVMAAAERGISGPGQPLPHLDRIQAAFGKHDVTGVRSHTDGRAQDASRSMGAKAYATGQDVAFGGTPDLHTAAHEAAHTVQQRHGVHTKSGVGQVGDKWEQHADAVANAVVQGRSAEGLLDQVAGSSARGQGQVQHKLAGPVQMETLDGAAVQITLDLGGVSVQLSVPVPELEGESYTCALPSPITGISNAQVTFNFGGGQITGGTVSGAFAFAGIQGEAAFTFGGDRSVTGSITRQWSVDGFGNGDVTLTLAGGAVTGTGTLLPQNYTLPGVTVTDLTGSVTVGEAGLSIQGSGNASLAGGLLSGTFSAGYANGAVTGHIDGQIGLPSFLVAWAAKQMDPSSKPKMGIDLSGSIWSGTVALDFPVSLPGVEGTAQTQLSYNSSSGFSGSGSGTFTIANFVGGSLTTTIDAGGGVGGSIALATNSYEGGGLSFTGIALTGTLANGVLTATGNGSVSALDGAVTGTFTAGIGATGFTFTPSVTVTLPSLNPSDFGLTYAAETGFSGSVTLNPSISILSGTVTLSYEGGAFSASGGFDVTTPFVRNVHLDVAFADGHLSSSATIDGSNINLPYIDVASSDIVLTYANDFSVAGSATLSAAGGAYSGTLTASWANDDLNASATGNLQPPGLNPIAFNLTKEGSNLTGSAATTISLPNVASTAITATYDGSRFGGSATVTLDLPYLQNASGDVTIGENGQLGGSFSIRPDNFSFSPLNVSNASVTATVENGAMNLSGTATVSTTSQALDGTATVTFEGTNVTATGGFSFRSSLFSGTTLNVGFTDNRLTGSVDLAPANINLPNISVTSSSMQATLAEDFGISGTAQVSAAGGMFTGGFTASWANNDFSAQAVGTFAPPGLTPTQITLTKDGDGLSGSVSTGISMGLVKSAQATVSYGGGRFSGGGAIELDLPILQSATGNLEIQEDGRVGGSATVEANDIVVPYMTVSGATVTATIDNGSMNLSGSATLAAQIAALSGSATLSFNGSDITATGGFTLASSIFSNAQIAVGYADGRVSAEGDIQPGNISLPMIAVSSSNLHVALADTVTVTGSASVAAAGDLFTGTMSVTWANNDLDASVAGTFRAPGVNPIAVSLTKEGDDLRGSASTTVSMPLIKRADVTVGYENGRFTGGGAVELDLPVLQDATGTLDLEPAGQVGGSLTVEASDIVVPHMIVRSASVTAAITNGAVDLSGNASIGAQISALSGDAQLNFAGSNITASGAFTLASSIFREARVEVQYAEGHVTAEGDLAPNNISLPMIQVSSSNIHVSIGEQVRVDGSANVAAAGVFSGSMSVTWTGSDLDAAVNGTVNAPGIRPIAVSLAKQGDDLRGSASTDLQIPLLKRASVTVGYQNGGFYGAGDIELDLPIIEGATGTMEMTPPGQIGGSLTVEARDIQLPYMVVQSASVTAALENGSLNLSGAATVGAEISALTGTAQLNFNGADISASGGFDLASSIFRSAHIGVTYADGRLTGDGDIQANDISLPMIAVTNSNIHVGLGESITVSGSASVAAAGNLFTGDLSVSWTGSDLDASVAGTFRAPGINPVAVSLTKQGDDFRGEASTSVNMPLVKSATVQVGYSGGRFSGGGAIELDLPIVSQATGRAELTPEGQVGGSITVEARDIQIPHMTVRSASVTAALENGAVTLSGSAAVGAQISALTGEAQVAFDGANITASGGFDLASSIFRSAHIGVTYANGQITGEGDIAANDISLPMISVTNSNIHVGLGENITVSGSASVAAAGNLYQGDMSVNWTGSDLDASVAGTFRPPGLNPIEFNLSKRGDELSGAASTTVTVPFVKSASINATYSGGRFGGGARVELDLPIVQSATGTIDIAPEGQVNGSLTVEAGDIQLPFLEVRSASVTAAVNNGDMNLSGSASLGARIAMLSGDAQLNFAGSNISASGGFDINTSFFRRARIDVSYADGLVSGSGRIEANDINLPALTVTNSAIQASIGEDLSLSGSAHVSAAGGLFDGNMTASYAGGNIDASVDGTFRPPGINPVQVHLAKNGDDIRGSASTTVNVPFTRGGNLTVTYANGQWGGRADLQLAVPFVQGGRAWAELTPEGQVNGGLEVNAGNIQLPFVQVNNASVTGAITNGVFSMQGSGSLTGIPLTNSCDFTLGVRGGNFYGSAAVDLQVPMCERARGELRLNEDGTMGGSVNVRAAISGVSGDVTANYNNGNWSGEGTLAYNRGPFTGSVTARLSEAGKLSGTGRVSYDVTPNFTITADVTMDEDGEMTIGGQIGCPSAIDLFSLDYEREIFSFMARFGIPGLSLQLPIVGVVGLEARLSGFLKAYAKLALQLTDIHAGGTFDTRTNNVELDIGGTIRGHAEAGIIAGIRFAFGLGIGPAFIGGYAQMTGKAGIEANVAAAVAAHYSSLRRSLGLDINLSASAGLIFELGLEAGLMAEIDLWLFEWSQDFPLASTSFSYRPGVNFNYNPSFQYDLLGSGPPQPDQIAPAEQKTIGNDDAQKMGGEIELDDSDRYEPCANTAQKFELDTEDEYEKGVRKLSSELSAGDAEMVMTQFGPKMMSFMSTEALTEVAVNFAKAGADLGRSIDWLIAVGGTGAHLVEMTAACPNAGFKAAVRDDGWKAKICGMTSQDEIAQVVDNLEGELEWKLRWMTQVGTNWTLVQAKVSAAPQGERDVLRTEEWMGIFTGLFGLAEIGELVVLLGGDLVFKYTWLFAAATDYAQLQEKATAAPQNERDMIRTEEWKAQIPGVTSPENMAELVDILGGDLHFKWDWMFAAGPLYEHIRTKAENAPQGERDACRTDSWRDQMCGAITLDNMAELVDVLGGDLPFKYDWMLTQGSNWGHILAKGEAAPQSERDLIRTDAWKPRLVGAVSTEEMAILVDILGGDLPFKLDWMYAKSAGWDLVMPKVEVAPQGERDLVRNDEWKPRFLGAHAHDELVVLVDMLAGLLDQKLDWLFDKGSNFGTLEAKVAAAPAGEYELLRNETWMARCSGVAVMEQMSILTEMLGWDLFTTMTWMLFGGTTWELLRAKITATGGEDHAALLGDPNRLKELEGTFGWDQMASTLELVGREIPGAAALLGDGAVAGAMANAWAASSPFPADPKGRHEEGGWFYMNLVTGSITVVTTSGDQASVDLGAAGEQTDSILVGYFHTHPNPSKEPDEEGITWTAEPSPADLAIAGAFEVPAFVVTDVGVIPYGPDQRPHLAGPKGLPGSGSSPAPQAVAGQQPVARLGQSGAVAQDDKKHPFVVALIKLCAKGAKWEDLRDILRDSGGAEREALMADAGVMRYLASVAPDSETLVKLMAFEKQPTQQVEGGGQARATQRAIAEERRAEQGGPVPGIGAARAGLKRSSKKMLMNLERVLNKPDLTKVNKRRVFGMIVSVVDNWEDHLRADIKPDAMIVRKQAVLIQKITLDPLRQWFDHPAQTGKVLDRTVSKTRMFLKTPKFIGVPEVDKVVEDVQAKARPGAAADPVSVPAVAAQGVSGSGGRLPHFQTIQQAFGAHDISGVRAHTGGQAASAAQAIGAEAYAYGGDVAFQGPVSLHTAAHEAAHVVQQRAGAQVAGGVGSAGDRWEQHADQVADAVVAGQSAEGLLNQVAAPSAGVASQSVQKKAVQRKASDTATEHLGKGYFSQYESRDALAGALDTSLQGEEQAVHASIAPVQEQMGPNREESPAGGPVDAPTTAQAVSNGVQGPEPGAPDIAPTPEVEAPASPRLGLLSQPTEEGDRSRQISDYQSNLRNIGTSVPGLQTNAGPPPAVELTGSADPERATRQSDESLAESERLRAEASTAVDTGPGPEQVQPVAVDVEHAVPMPEVPAFEAPGAIPKADEFVANSVMTQEIKDKTDQLGQGQLDASLSAATSQVAAAQTEHQASIERTQTEQEQKQAEMIETANRDMDAEVERQRTAISGKQTETKRQQQAEVDAVRGQSDREKAKLQQDIDARVAADQASIETKFAEAESEATAQKADAEREAERKRAEAERAAEDESWWDSVSNAVSEAFNAIADAVNAVLDACVEAVNAIVDAAKDFATGLIDACVSFVTEALEAYGELLKGLVDGLLGDIFPGLAAALTAFIDEAVALATRAINAIGEALKAAVTALLDSIGAALTGLIAAYKAAIAAAIALANAVLTGDWEALGRMILEGVLQLAGIPPADFYALINNAMDSIDQIIADPGAFAGNVISAVGQGFGQFGDNFLTHLQTGFFEWLAGPLGEMGVSLPTSFDVKGIFGLVAQVIGLTQEGIRGIITEELGETAGAVFDYIWRYVGALINGGIEGLWQEIQNDLSSLWEMVVDGIKSYVLETIVKQAVLRLATMWNPAGALINAVMAAYNVYQWLKTNVQRIWGVVTAVVDMIGGIASGNLGPAANAIESALAGLIPIAISLLANLLGLGGIATKVREIIESVRTTVQGAVRSLIRRVRGMFQGGGEEGAAPEGGDGVVGETVNFSAEDGEAHRLWIDTSGAQATVMVASDPKPVPDQLAEFERELPTKIAAAKRGEVQGLIGQARTLWTGTDTAADASATANGANDDQVVAKQRQLAGLMGRLFTEFGMRSLEAECAIDGGVAARKWTELNSDRYAAGLLSGFVSACSEKLTEQTSLKALDAMRGEVQRGGRRYLGQGPRVPESELVANGGVSRVAPLGAIWQFNLPAAVKSQRFLDDEQFFIAAVNGGLYNPDADLSGNISGQLAQAWWFPSQRAPSATINELRRDLALGDTPAYAAGAIRFDFTPADAMAGLELHKPTCYDGMPFNEFVVDNSNVWGTTAGGMPEGVAPAIGIQKASRRTPVPGPANAAKVTELFHRKYAAAIAAAHPDAQQAIRDAIGALDQAGQRAAFAATGTDAAALKGLVGGNATLVDMGERPLTVGAWGATNVTRAQTGVRAALAQLSLTEANLPGDAAQKNAAAYVDARKGVFSRAGTYDRSRNAMKDNIWSAALDSQVADALTQDFKDRLGDGHDQYAIKDGSIAYSPCSNSDPKQPPPAGTPYSLTYETMNGQRFTVQISASGLTESIESNNLNLKSVGGPQQRANTVQDSGSIRENEAQHRAHLIADEFRGSGFRASANVASTSGIYNSDQRPGGTMRWAEVEIGDWIRDEARAFGVPDEFSLAVSVRWGDLSDQDPGFRGAVRANAAFLRDVRNESAATPTQAQVDADIQAYLGRHPTTKLQRIKGITYTARVKLADGGWSPSKVVTIGPDIWLATKIG